MYYKGCYTALLTPFKEGNLDEGALVRLLQHQEVSGIHGVVLCGTTAEVDLLSEKEYRRVLEIGVETLKIPLIAGVGSPSTQKALDMAMMAQKIGVQGILAVTPYYVKPTSAGVMAHFKQIHDGVSLPMIVYSNPRRTGFEIEESLLDDILTLPRVIGIKDSTSDLQRIEKLGKKFQNTSFEYTCGEDSMIQEFLKHGSNTWISVISNLYPNRCKMIMEKVSDDQILHHIQVLDVGEPNPVPIKYAVSLLGLCGEDVRLPLLPLMGENKEKIRQGLSL